MAVGPEEQIHTPAEQVETFARMQHGFIEELALNGVLAKIQKDTARELLSVENSDRSFADYEAEEIADALSDATNYSVSGLPDHLYEGTAESHVYVGVEYHDGENHHTTWLGEVFYWPGGSVSVSVMPETDFNLSDVIALEKATAGLRKCRADGILSLLHEDLSHLEMPHY